MKRFATLVLTAIAAFAPATTQATDRPNIIVVLTDDQGWGDFSCHGNPVLETPNLDAVAARGASFSRFYVSPVCSPTRACLMTGRYNHRTGVVDTFKGGSMMHAGEVTIAEVLRDAGYATGIFGKWHLGDCFPMRAQDQGFQRSVVLRGGGLGQPSEPKENNARYTDPILFYDGQQRKASGYCTDVYFDQAMRFIEDQADAEKPFFAYIATNTPHSPYHDVPEDLYQKYKSRDLSPVLLGADQTADTVARVYAMVENIDQNMGRLSQFLKQRNLTDQTLLVFFCDNGPNTARYVGERRGKKTDVNEGGIASPLFVNWPGRVEPGTRVDVLSAHIDLMPTLLDAAGVPAPSEVEFDGRSLLGHLTGAQDRAWPERTLFIQAHRGLDQQLGRHVAAVGQRYKLVRPSGFQGTAVDRETRFELYDLARDPTESTDLMPTDPSRGRQLVAQYERWFRDVYPPAVRELLPPAIVIGDNAEAETVLTWQDWQATGPGWGTQGQWRLRSAGPSVFRVRVLLESSAAGHAVLTLGDQQLTQQLPASADEVVFPSAPAPSGDFMLGFELRSGEQKIPPYQVIISQVAEGA